MDLGWGGGSCQKCKKEGQVPSKVIKPEWEFRRHLKLPFSLEIFLWEGVLCGCSQLEQPCLSSLFSCKDFLILH